jgi:hypothetical protein
LEIRQLIREMSLANPLWGAPRLHGELLKLGIDASLYGENIHACAASLHSSSFYFFAEGFRLWFDGFTLARILGHLP